MGLWEIMEKLPVKHYNGVIRIYLLYKRHIPIEVRALFSTWIEKNILIHIDADDPKNEERIDNIMKTFTRLIEMQFSKLSRYLLDPNSIPGQMAGGLISLIYTYKNSPSVGIFKIIRDCLIQEIFILTYHEAFERSHRHFATIFKDEKKLTKKRDFKHVDVFVEIDAYLECVQYLMRLLDNEQNAIPRINEEVRKLEELTRGMKCYSASRSTVHETFNYAYTYLENKVSTILRLREKIRYYTDKLMNRLKKMTNFVADEYEEWWKVHKFMTRDETTIAYQRSKLEILQKYQTQLYRMINSNKEQLDRMLNLLVEVQIAPNDPYVRITRRWRQNRSWMSLLLMKSIIVEDQPTRIILPNTRLSTTLRFLVIEYSNHYRIDVHVYLVNVDEARNIFYDRRNVNLDAIRDKLSNARGIIKRDNDILRYRFDDMTVREEFLQENVRMNKYWLAFSVTFQSMEEPIRLWVCSLPMVRVNESADIYLAKEMIFNDDNFYDDNYTNELFEKPITITWVRYVTALDKMFKMYTGINLSDVDKYGLFNTMYHRNNCTDYANATITLDCKITSNEGNFTFWRWFYEATIVARNHLRSFWKLGVVQGFASYDYTNSVLSNNGTANGTFAIVIDKNELATIDVVWIEESLTKGRSFMYEKFTATDLEAIPLHARLESNSEWKYFLRTSSMDGALELCKKSYLLSNVVQNMEKQSESSTNITSPVPSEENRNLNNDSSSLPTPSSGTNTEEREFFDWIIDNIS